MRQEASCGLFRLLARAPVRRPFAHPLAHESDPSRKARTPRDAKTQLRRVAQCSLHRFSSESVRGMASGLFRTLSRTGTTCTARREAESCSHAIHVGLFGGQMGGRGATSQEWLFRREEAAQGAQSLARIGAACIARHNGVECWYPRAPRRDGVLGKGCKEPLVLSTTPLRGVSEAVIFISPSESDTRHRPGLPPILGGHICEAECRVAVVAEVDVGLPLGAWARGMGASPCFLGGQTRSARDMLRNHTSGSSVERARQSIVELLGSAQIGSGSGRLGQHLDPTSTA